MSMTRQEWSLNAASVELKVDRRRIAAALDGVERAGGTEKRPTYWLADIVRAIYDREDLNPSEEKAKLDKVKREREELKLATEQGLLVATSEVKAKWYGLVMNFKGKMLPLASKVAPLVAAQSGVPECEKIIKAEVFEALTELSEGEKDG